MRIPTQTIMCNVVMDASTACHPRCGVTNPQPAAGHSKVCVVFQHILAAIHACLGKTRNVHRPGHLASWRLQKTTWASAENGRKKRIVISTQICQKMLGGKKVAGRLVKNITLKTLYIYICVCVIHRYIKYHIIGILSIKFSGLKNCKWIHNI